MPDEKLLFSAMVFIVDEGPLTRFQTGLITAVFYVVYALLLIADGVDRSGAMLAWLIMIAIALLLSIITLPVWGKFLRNR